MLDGLKEIKVCVGYELDGQKIDYLASLYEGTGGREADLRVRSRGGQKRQPGRAAGRSLPAQAVKYVRYIEELIGAPVAMLSTSPERLDTILVQDPFQD